MSEVQINVAPIISIDSEGVAFKPSESVAAAPRGVVSVRVADVDNDGDLDLFAGTFFDDAGIHVLVNDGAGNFTLGAKVADNNVWRPLVADLDGDGNVDYASINYGTSSVLWYKGNGDGTFGTAQQLAAGAQQTIAAADLDADGDLDVVTIASSAINMQKNNGDGTFSEVAIASGVSGVYSVAVGDLNGDGSLDLVAVTSSGGFAAYLADGAGGFTASDSESVKNTLGLSYGYLENVRVADIDGDGNLDAIAASANDQGIYLLRGNGDGTFAAAEVLASGSNGGRPGTVDIEIVDVNGDGKLDVLAPSMGMTPTGGGTLSWFEHKSDGSFEEHVIVSATHTTASEFVDIAVGDFNGDGTIDLLSSGSVYDAGSASSSHIRIASGSPSLVVNENAATAITGVTFSDDKEGPVVVTFTVDRGTLSAVAGGGVAVEGTGAEVILTGTVADINTFIAAGNLTFLTDVHDETAAVLTVLIDDQDPAAPATATTELLLAVEPMYDEAPSLSLDNSVVAENSPIGTVIGTLSATDPEGGPVTLSLLADPWNIVSLDGDKIVLDAAVDHETGASYDIVVRATDVGGEITDKTFTITVSNVNEAPTSVALSNLKVIENSAAGTVVGMLSTADPDIGDTFTYSIANDTGAFEIVNNQLVVKDLGDALKHSVTIVSTDAGGLTTEKTFKMIMTDADGNPIGSNGMITIDASTATAGMNFDAYIRGGFLAGTTGGGFPVFDNSGAFTGEEMLLGFGSAPTSKYVLMHGELQYYFGTHTVAGTANIIEYGTRGSGDYDADGYFTGGSVELRITDIDLSNPIPTSSAEEAEIEANGPIHNFAVGHMYGYVDANGDGVNDYQTRLDKYADSLDDYAQHFIGSNFNDTFVGTIFNDVIEGGGGNDTLSGGGGDDEISDGSGRNTINGDDGVDTYVVNGNRADYDVYIYSSATYMNVKGQGSIYDTLRTMEYIRFNDVLIDLLTKEETPIGGNIPPGDLALSANQIAENSALGTVIGELSATDADGDPLTYTLEDDADGRFALVIEEGATKLVVNGALDYEAAASHDIVVKVSDGNGGETTETFTIAVVDINENQEEPTMITINASTASAGMNFEEFIRGGFLSDTSGGGMPVFDNSAAFSGEEMMVGFGSDPTSKYVLAHGSLAYFFGTHTVWGDIETIEYGRRGAGTFDGDGYFSGGDVELSITGLTDFANAQAPEATVEATGEVHNFAVAHMYGAAASQARLDLYAEQLDQYAQHFIGSAYGDVYSGTAHDDSIEGGAGDDILSGGLGNDTIRGGDGLDTADYSEAASAVTVRLSTIQAQDTGGAGIDILHKVERLVGSDYGDSLIGSARADSIYGGLGDDSINGNGEDDLLSGGAGLDTLRGGDGNDTLIGGADRDILVGGTGEDTFVFTAASDSARGVDTRDTIRDFEGAGVAGGDVIDLSALNSETVTLSFYDDGKFHGGAGDVRSYQSAGGNTFVEVDIDGDKQADLQIVLSGLHGVTEGDLIL